MFHGEVRPVPKHVFSGLGFIGLIGFIRDSSNYIRVLLYSYYTTITVWGVLLKIGLKVQGSGLGFRV